MPEVTEVTIRRVRPDDLNRVVEIEAACFPPVEAASRQSFQARIAAYPEYFLVAESNGTLIGLINGCATNSDLIYDELYHSTRHHDPGGKYLAVFGLDVIPEYRGRGIAAQLMRNFIQIARETGRQGIILTCKDRLVRYYESFGYVNKGISQSNHGGAQWFDMTLIL